MNRLRFAAMLIVLAARAEVSFNRDIRPIMADTCFRCHGPDKNARMAGFRIDIREEAIKATPSGAIPIVPGDPAKSAIIDRVFSSNPAKIMPPKYAHKELTQAQKDTIRRWVAEGAKYEGHWAYLPIVRPPVPKSSPKSTLRNPIDVFVQARLAREGLQPSKEADRRTLIRRVSLDLTGIPPTPAEIAAFVNDKSPGAYEKLVERLLDSPRYAEKRAIAWLDAVRYADTCGFHGDNVFPAWPYRDYVLRSFRDNKRFDEFTREQIAGDLIPDATVDQKVASAYNRLTRTSAEGGLQPKEYLAKYAADRVRTTSVVWLGATVGCAECHDHKFDPLTAKDFYSFKAFFADIRETGLVPDKGARAWGSQLALPTEEQRARREDLVNRVAEVQRLLKESAASSEAWEKPFLEKAEKNELAWHYQRPISAKSARGARLAVYNDEMVDNNYYTGSTLLDLKQPGNGLVVASGPNPDNETYTVVFKPGAGEWTALGLEVVQDEALPAVRVARGGDRLVISELEAEHNGSKIEFVLASSNVNPALSPQYLPMNAIDGDLRTGWGVATYGDNTNLMLALRFKEKLRTAGDSLVTVRIRHESEYRRATMGRFRIALSSAEHSWPEPEDVRQRRARGGPLPPGGITDAVLRALRVPSEKRNQAENNVILSQFQWASPPFEPLVAELARLDAELGRLDVEIPRVVVTEAVAPSETRVLPRGNWMDESGEIVEPAIPAFLGKLETNGRRATRLDLADWIVSRSNPLTARVFVNRLWREFFGAGLSKILEDLGSQGEWPSHPELLDWLAAEFMEGWDVKHLVRTIVLSHTYRQSSDVSKTLQERDPDNRLLARQSRMRVEAELVRDIALSASGLLVEKFGGPSTRPYQPEGYLAALNFPKRDYSESRGEDLYRRGVYVLWQRTFLHPSLMTFDAPTREECTVNRTTSNTPLQALVLLNDPIYVEAARVFAANILALGKQSVDSRIEDAFERAIGRKPSRRERSELAGLYRKSLKQFVQNPKEADALLSVGEAPVPERMDAVQLAAMTTVTRVVLNLHETITRY